MSDQTFLVTLYGVDDNKQPAVLANKLDQVIQGHLQHCQKNDWPTHWGDSLVRAYNGNGEASQPKDYRIVAGPDGSAIAITKAGISERVHNMIDRGQTFTSLAAVAAAFSSEVRAVHVKNIFYNASVRIPLPVIDALHKGIDRLERELGPRPRHTQGPTQAPTTPGVSK